MLENSGVGESSLIPRPILYGETKRNMGSKAPQTPPSEREEDMAKYNVPPPPLPPKIQVEHVTSKAAPIPYRERLAPIATSGSIDPADWIPSREICKACGLVNTVGFDVPDPVWKHAVPEGWRNSVLCLACFTRFADEHMIPWDKYIKFFPVSFKTHIEGEQ